MSPDRPELEGPAAGSSGTPADLSDLGRVTAELLHDLGGMLSVLDGHVALARSEDALGRSVSPELSDIQRQTREMRRMVLDIVEELKGGPRSPDLAVQAEPLIEEVVDRWVPTAPGLTTSLDVALPDRASVPGPRSFLSRTLTNLLRNAGRHARSEVRVRAELSASGRALVIVVADDGEGVDPGVAERLFDPLVTGTGGATGLGLSFVRWAAARLGGSVELEPEHPLGGAAFRLRIPLTPAKPRRRALSRHAAFEGDSSPLEGLRIAVVDDEPAVVRVLERRLESEGADVLALTVAPDEGLTSFLDRMQEWAPDVVLLDLNLGHRSGLTLHEALTRTAPELGVRTIFLTGDTPPDPPPGPPVVHKLVEWDELVGRILEVDEGASDLSP